MIVLKARWSNSLRTKHKTFSVYVRNCRLSVHILYIHIVIPLSGKLVALQILYRVMTLFMNFAVVSASIYVYSVCVILFVLLFSLSLSSFLFLSFYLLFYFPFQLSSMRRLINEYIFAASHAETRTSASLLFSLSFTFSLLFLLSLSIALYHYFSDYALLITC